MLNVVYCRRVVTTGEWEYPSLLAGHSCLSAYDNHSIIVSCYREISCSESNSHILNFPETFNFVPLGLSIKCFQQ